MVEPYRSWAMFWKNNKGNKQGPYYKILLREIVGEQVEITHLIYHMFLSW